jgi:hypothetical protein
VNVNKVEDREPRTESGRSTPMKWKVVSITRLAGKVLISLVLCKLLNQVQLLYKDIRIQVVLEMNCDYCS